MNLDEQKLSSHTHKKFQILINRILEANKNVLTSPQQLDADTLFEGMADHLVSTKESEFHEFKSSARWDLKENNIFDHIWESWIITIVAFLNTNGGNLILGVEERHGITKVLGIEIDKFKSQDEYHRYIKDKIDKKIGIEFLENYISIHFHNIQDKVICQVQCKRLPRGRKAYFFENKKKTKFYKRSGPSNIELSINEFDDYQKERK